MTQEQVNMLDEVVECNIVEENRVKLEKKEYIKKTKKRLEYVICWLIIIDIVILFTKAI